MYRSQFIQIHTHTHTHTHNHQDQQLRSEVQTMKLCKKKVEFHYSITDFRSSKNDYLFLSNMIRAERYKFNRDIIYMVQFLGGLNEFIHFNSLGTW